MGKIFIKPAHPGLLIRYPQNLKQKLPPEGAHVEEHREWHRKITFGDVVLAEAPSDDVPKKGKGSSARTFTTQPEGDNQ